MAIQYRWPHAFATLIAIAAVVYQTMVIWETLEGVSPTVKAGIPIATVAAAFLPIFAETAWHQRSRFKALVLWIPVFALLGYVLPVGVSRLGEAQAQRRDTASMTQVDQTRLRAELDQANRLVAEAQTWIATECATGRGKKCEGQALVLQQRQAMQRELQARVGGLTAATIPWLPIWHAALLPIGLELTAWSALFFGLGPLTRTRPAVVAVTERDLAVEPLTDDEIEEIRRLLIGLGRPVSNGELAELIARSPGETSKRVSRGVEAGVLRKERNGREVAITLH